MSGRVDAVLPAPPDLDAETVEAVAELSQAFASPSRVRILVRLWRSPASVTVLAGDIGMEQSAVSHQLRLLRHLNLVRTKRDGQTVVYSLRDGHVAVMLQEAINHVDHVRLGDAGALRLDRQADQGAADPGRPRS